MSRRRQTFERGQRMREAYDKHPATLSKDLEAMHRAFHEEANAGIDMFDNSCAAAALAGAAPRKGPPHEPAAWAPTPDYTLHTPPRSIWRDLWALLRKATR